jgi:uncharacterized protein (TIGR02466 family)
MEQHSVEVMPLFSQPIYISKIELSDNIIDHVKKLEYYEMSSSSGWLSEDTMVLDHPVMSNLKSILIDNVNNYAHNVLQIQDDIEFYITNSWVTLHQENDYSPPHHHDNSLFSGTVYINIPDDDESVFEFFAPPVSNIFGFLTPKFKEWNLLNSRNWFIKPETGTTIIFPSNLVHGTSAMTSSVNNRYCLAYNVFARGDFYSVWQEGKNPINRLVL